MGNNENAGGKGKEKGKRMKEKRKCGGKGDKIGRGAKLGIRGNGGN